MGRILMVKLMAVLLFLISLGGTGMADDQISGGEVALGDRVLRIEGEAIGWLKQQMVPNEVVPEPHPERRRLLISYRVAEDHPAFRYIYSRSFAYDNALAVIALAMAGEYQEAELILTALQRNVRDDGSFWFTYNTVNSWPNEEDNEGAIIRTGAVCWIGYAATFYLGVRAREDEFFLDEDLLARDLLIMAEKMGEWVLARQVDDPDDLRHGLITGGWGTYQLAVDNGEKGLIERYRGDEITWVSMEHNIDAYYFLRDLGRLTGDERYKRAAEKVAQGILTLWRGDRGQFIRGIKGDQAIDAALPLDGASWASLFLSSIGEDGKAKRCLNTVERSFRCQSGGVWGYRPYYADPVFEEHEVNTHFFPDDPDKRWRDVDIVWGEGSLGVAAAYIKNGQRKRALDIVEDLLPLSTEGGFRYATVEIPYQFSSDPSVASTAWFVMVVEMLKRAEMNAAFWDR